MVLQWSSSETSVASTPPEAVQAFWIALCSDKWWACSSVSFQTVPWPPGRPHTPPGPPPCRTGRVQGGGGRCCHPSRDRTPPPPHSTDRALQPRASDSDSSFFPSFQAPSSLEGFSLNVTLRMNASKWRHSMCETEKDRLTQHSGCRNVPTHTAVWKGPSGPNHWEARSAPGPPTCAPRA